MFSRDGAEVSRTYRPLANDCEGREGRCLVRGRDRCRKARKAPSPEARARGYSRFAWCRRPRRRSRSAGIRTPATDTCSRRTATWSRRRPSIAVDRAVRQGPEASCVLRGRRDPEGCSRDVSTPTGASRSTSVTTPHARRSDGSRPCQTFNRAYALAQCGDVIDVDEGSYPEQDIRETATGSACAPRNRSRSARPQERASR